MGRPHGLRAAIVSTMRSPGRAHLLDWLAYHRAIGFRHFFLYFDDPNDPDQLVAQRARDVTVVRRDAALMKRLRSYSLWREFGAFATRGQGGDRTMARQMLHIQDALRRIARMRPALHWLLHIDHDELFVAPGARDVGDHFAQLEAIGAEQAVYVNHEAVPESLEVSDVFRDVALFKRNPRVVRRMFGKRAERAAESLFMAYWNGKAAARISPGVVPSGVHFFDRPGRELETRWLEEPYILHYPGCGFTRWRAKYETLGDFGDRWWGKQPIVLRAHLRSRDLRAQPDAVARAFFRAHAMLGGPTRRGALRKRGLLVRITAVQRRLRHR